MLDQTQQWQPLWWEETPQGARVRLLDQTLLPLETVYLTLGNAEEVAEAIRALRVRGAPAIAAAAAFGVVLGLREQIQVHGTKLSVAEARACAESVGALLTATRPTAVNLAWAVKRLLRRADALLNELDTAEDLARLLLDEAQAIVREDRAACQRMGELGAELIAEGDTLLTHCNTGALATMGIGTALAPFYIAHRAGKRIHVLVDETRPVLQGARLTAWELQRAGVPLTLITDNMAASFMRQGRVQAVFVGADRIVANGDVANKIGTYSVAVLARAHQIPFYVVAPTSTFDCSLASGEEIPVEQRNPAEVTSIRGMAIAPVGVQVANPAFDVTPHQYVSALITEKGIFRPPYDVALRHAW
ncbi:MAG TPA: S-methyl-5-thioribose-1-phosphate isomerase [Ktedonobacteraceae bacterium]|nr:S-methyl-5-thioribose-1-phosphate isomerase [Ktedonobacteraceae bacterium]